MPRSSVEVRYVALTPDEEWILAVQEWAGRPGAYRMRLVRRKFILVDAGFELKPGESIKQRLDKACEEWVARPGQWERMFHANARGMGVEVPSYARRGRTPFNCSGEEFWELVTSWAMRVPPALRQQDFRLFLRWEEANRAMKVG